MAGCTVVTHFHNSVSKSDQSLASCTLKTLNQQEQVSGGAIIFWKLQRAFETTSDPSVL